MADPSAEKSGLSGRAIAIFIVVGACLIAVLTVNWDRGRTKVGAFYDIAPRLGGIAPVGLANKGNTDHYRVAFRGPEIFAIRRMTTKGGPLQLYDNASDWNWFLAPESVCLDCKGPTVYGAIVSFVEGEVTRVDFGDIDGQPVQHYTVSRDDASYTLTHSMPSLDRGVQVEKHLYDAWNRLQETSFEGGGVRFVRDESGRVVEEIHRGRDKNRLRYTYGEPRHPARPTEVAAARPDVHGCTVVQTDWDSIGHPVQVRCLDAARQPVFSSVGCASFDIFWDADNWTTSCLGLDGAPTTSKDGWVHLRVKTDPMAYPHIVAFLDGDGEEVTGPDGASKIRIERDDRGQVLEYSRFGPDGATVPDK